MRLSLPFRLFAAGIAASVFACNPSGSGGGSTQPCTAPTGAGTTHTGTISTSETWSAAASPHNVTGDLTLKNATVTVEDCAVVQLSEGVNVNVLTTTGTPSQLITKGTVATDGSGNQVIRQVTFQSAVSGKSWGSIRVSGTASLDLSVTLFDSGGNPTTSQAYGGTLVAVGPGVNGPLTKMLGVHSVAISNSGGFGINVQGYAAFTDDSDDLTISGAGKLAAGANIAKDTRYPVYIETPAVGTLPAGTYTSNAVDAILVLNPSTFSIDETFHDRGVPYRFETGFNMSPKLSVAEGGLSTLTIEAGVTLQLLKTTGNVWSFNLGTSNGNLPANIFPVKLIASGTSNKPIIFTSGGVLPAAGDWGGIEWKGGPATGNIMSHVIVQYGGGDSGNAGFGCGPGDNDALLAIFNWEPQEAFIQNCAFQHSAAGGIVSGWRSDDAGPNLKTGNTFSTITGVCQVSRWQNANGSCPGTPPVCL